MEPGKPISLTTFMLGKAEKLPAVVDYKIENRVCTCLKTGQKFQKVHRHCSLKINGLNGLQKGFESSR